MGYDVTEVQNLSADVHWWKTQRTGNEIADHLTGSIVDKKTLERRLAEIAQENAVLRVQCSVATKELATERQRLQAEIAVLKSRVSAAESAPVKTGGGRLVAECAARERLLKDEFERIVQSLRVDLKMERQRHETQLKTLKDRMEGCICGEFRIEKAVHKSAVASALPERWIVRSSKS
jgi:hypothetical protein